MDNTLYKLYPLIPRMPTWAEVNERISTAPNVDDAKRLEWRKAVDFLRTELGQGFFHNCGKDHPVYLKLTNCPHLLDELVDFTNTLQDLKNCDSNYDYLLGKIKPREKCINEGACFTELASTYLKEGFEVRFPENTSEGKSPDIEIVDPLTGDRFFIEVSKVNDSAKRKQTHDEFSAISNTFLGYGFDLLYSYKQLKHLCDDEIKEILERIKRMKDDAVTNKSLEVFRNDKIDLAVAHPDRNAYLVKWCEENGRSHGASGLEVDFNDTPRIIHHKKIYKKVKQIPAGETGILYMPIQYLYFFCMNSAETTIQIIKEISQYPNLLGVVLYANLGQQMKEEFIEVANCVRSIKMINGIARHVLFVFNLDYNGNLKEETWQKTKRCF